MQEKILLTLPNDLRELQRVNEVANSFLERRGLAHATVYVTNLALEEILSNVIKYGYEDLGRHEISVSLGVDEGGVELHVVDDGRQFDPMAAPAVDVDVPLEERRVGGLGIHLLRTMATQVRYRRAGGRNHLCVRI